MSLTTKTAIARCLSGQDNLTEQFLSQCDFSIKESVLFIDCQNEELLRSVQQRVTQVAQTAIAIGITNIALTCNGVIRNQFSPAVILEWADRQKETMPVIQAPSMDDGRAIAINTIATNQGVLCSTALGQIDKLDPVTYQGFDVSKLNIPDEYDRYIHDLLHHQKLSNYPLRTLDGEGNPQLQYLNVYLANFSDSLVRVVEVLSVECD